MTPITETTYLSRDNTVSLEFKKDGTTQSLSTITRVRIIFNDHLELDSSATTNVLDWTTTSTQLDITLGQEDIPEGTYPNTHIVMYDSQNTNGVVWGEIDMIVKSGRIA